MATNGKRDNYNAILPFINLKDKCNGDTHSNTAFGYHIETQGHEWCLASTVDPNEETCLASQDTRVWSTRFADTYIAVW